ncbi:MAG: nucleotidyltransferase family protein [Pseudomonadota bacterium]
MDRRQDRPDPLPPALILAGGLGTRLRPVVSDLPKPMAPAGGKPFLEHLLRWLGGQGIGRAVLLVHYMGAAIETHFGNGARWGITIDTVHEPEALGTGGAVVHAVTQLGLDGPFFLLNGDSFIDVDLDDFHRSIPDGENGMVLTHRSTPGKYGIVEMDPDGRITRFAEKGSRIGRGLVNAGCYFLQPGLFQGRPPIPCAIETDLFPEWIAAGTPIRGYPCDGFFIDIGTPDDYRRFQSHVEKGATA